MDLTYRIKKSGDADGATDAEVNMAVSVHLPILTLTPTFVDRCIVHEDDAPSNSSDNVLYNNETGNELDIILNASLGYTTNESILALDKDTKRLYLVPGLNDVKPSQFANRSIALQSMAVGATTQHYNSGEKISLCTDSRLNDVVIDPGMVGASGSLTGAKIVTLAVRGMDVGNETFNLRQDLVGHNHKVALDARLVSFLELDVSNSGIDISEMIFYTILSDAFSHQRLRYVGKDTTADKIYIPLY